LLDVTVEIAKKVGVAEVLERVNKEVVDVSYRYKEVVMQSLKSLF